MALILPCAISIIILVLAYMFCGEKLTKRQREFESMEMAEMSPPPESAEIDTEFSDKELYPHKEGKIII